MKIAEALTADGTTPREIADAVLAAGYRSDNARFGQAVAAACSAMHRDGAIVRKRRGGYAREARR